MSKLTAERARERIEHLKAWQSTRGLTLREEEYLEALEIALTVLDQPLQHDNLLRAEGAQQVAVLIMAVRDEFPETSHDIVEECANIAGNLEAKLRYGLSL